MARNGETECEPILTNNDPPSYDSAMASSLEMPHLQIPVHHIHNRYQHQQQQQQQVILLKKVHHVYLIYIFLY